MVKPSWKMVWQFLKKSDTLLPYNLATVLLCIHPKKLKTYLHTKTCTWIFLGFFIMAQIWKQPKCPSVGKWINKLVHPDNGILFNAKRK